MEIKDQSRPNKSGYLLKQANSVFDTWNSRFFFLDGTSLLYFLDETMDKPRNIISLKGCIIDGIWPKDSYYTFTIRSLADDDLFYYLGAFTELEVQDWITQLKAATQLIELEEITKKLMSEQRNDEEEADFLVEMMEEKPHSVFGEQGLEEMQNEAKFYLPSNYEEVKKGIPPDLEKTLEMFKKLLKIKENDWKLIKHETIMKIFLMEDQFENTYKGIFILDVNFSLIVNLFENEFNNILWNFYLDYVNIVAKINSNTQIYDCEYKLYMKNVKCVLRDIYLSHAWMESNDKFFLIKKSMPNIKISKKKNKFNVLFPLWLDFNLQGLKIEKLDSENQKCLITIIIQTKKFNFIKQKIIHKFIMSLLVNYTTLKWDLSEITEALKLKERIILNETLLTEKNASFLDEQEIHQIKEQKEKIERISFTTQKSLKKLSSTVQIKLASNDVPLDRKSQLTEQNYENFLEMKKMAENLQNDYVDDNCLIRFLIARNFNAKDAFKMLENTLKFRAEKNLDKINLSDFDDYWKLGIYLIVEGDKKGRPIFISRACKFFPERLDPEKFKLFFLCLLEELTRRIPKSQDQFITIVDANNLTNENSNISILKFQIDILQLYYPERLYKLFLVNMAWFQKTIWYAVKPFVKDSTRKKISLIGDNNEEIFKAISEEIDPELIPVDLGGKNLI